MKRLGNWRFFVSYLKSFIFLKMKEQLVILSVQSLMSMKRLGCFLCLSYLETFIFLISTGLNMYLGEKSLKISNYMHEPGFAKLKGCKGSKAYKGSKDLKTPKILRLFQNE